MCLLQEQHSAKQSEIAISVPVGQIFLNLQRAGGERKKKQWMNADPDLVEGIIPTVFSDAKTLFREITTVFHYHN